MICLLSALKSIEEFADGDTDAQDEWQNVKLRKRFHSRWLSSNINIYMFKSYIQKKLEKYVKRYFEKHPEVKLVAVAGSVGKTSTKMAIATVLARSLRVRMEDTNHNTHMSAPLSILGIEYPSNVHSPLEWLRVFRAAHKRIKQPTDVDVIVQELGSDRPGEIKLILVLICVRL